MSLSNKTKKKGGSCGYLSTSRSCNLKRERLFVEYRHGGHEQFNANSLVSFLFCFVLFPLSVQVLIGKRLTKNRSLWKRKKKRSRKEKMSVISSRDPGMITTAMSTTSRTSATLTRPGSRSSELRPIFLLERCLAIRFERMVESTAATAAPSSKKSESRPASSLSQLSNWFNFHQQRQPNTNANSTPLPPAAPESCASSDRTIRQQQAKEPAALVKDSSAPAGWVYDGGFVLYQVSLLLDGKT